MTLYYCKQCGKEITDQSKSGRCRHCGRLGKSKIKISKQILYKLYITEKKTMRQIAKIYNCSMVPIRHKLKNYNIKIRTVGEARIKEKTTVHCTICYQDFKVYPYRLKETEHFYCCKQCWSIGHGIFGNIPTGKKNHSFTHGKYSKLTVNRCECGKIIAPMASHCRECYFKHSIGSNSPTWKGGPKPRKNQCPECGNLKMKEASHCAACAKKGKRNPCYLHGKGYGNYTSDFNKSLKTIIRERDNYCCQRCGISEKEYLNLRNKNLDVHHIDYNRQNCKQSNLITLCNRCNLQANFNIDYWYAYYTERINQIFNS